MQTHKYTKKDKDKRGNCLEHYCKRTKRAFKQIIFNKETATSVADAGRVRSNDFDFLVDQMDNFHFNQQFNDDRRANFVGAASIGASFAGNQGLKLAYVHSKTLKDVGATTNTVLLAWSILFK